MKSILTALPLFLLFTAAAGLQAAPIDTFRFKDAQTEEAFHRLSNELRCLVCQNQSIADSNADLAQDLRTEIYGMLQEGKSEEEIVAFMVERYGDYVLYRPPMKPMTWLLWFGPVLILIAGFIWVMRIVRRQAGDSAEAEELVDEEAERLRHLQGEIKLKDRESNS